MWTFKELKVKRVTFIFTCLLLAVPCQARTITVDDDGPADFNTIQAAIDNSNNGDTIEVQPGRYTGLGNRDIDFKGKAITIRSSDPNDPNIVAATVIDGLISPTMCMSGDCERHRGFKFHNGEGPDSVIAGLTITNFCSPDELLFDPDQAWPVGGGIYCENSSPTITYCVITNNQAYVYLYEIGMFWGLAGGVFSWGGSPTITNCVISGNRDRMAAGGLCCYGSAQIINCTITGNHSLFGTGGIVGGSVISHCIIEHNTSGLDVGGISSNGTIANSRISNNSGCDVGGGVYGSPLISNCIITGNSVGAGRGGGVHCLEGARIINCLVSGNSARSQEYFDGWVEGEAGGIYCSDANVLVSNCTIVSNWADANGGGIYGNPTITNSIVWGNNCPNEPQISGVPNISYSDIQDGWLGIGNINVDPNFADVSGGDYHLKSQAGRWDANEGRWTKDEVTSLCIDAGDQNSPIGLEPFPNGGIINMGAYGGTREASKSYFGEPPCETIVAGDINGDCKVDFKDFALMAFHWLEER